MMLLFRYIDLILTDANNIDAPIASVDVKYVGRNVNPPQISIGSMESQY